MNDAPVGVVMKGRRHVDDRLAKDHLLEPHLRSASNELLGWHSLLLATLLLWRCSHLDSGSDRVQATVSRSTFVH